MTSMFIMKNKSEAFEKFNDWKFLIENKVGKKIKMLQTDKGLEFCSSEIYRFCKYDGIASYHTVRNTPKKNVLAERMNRTLLKRVRCIEC